MDFGTIGLISLFYGVLAIRCVWQLAHHWRETFDDNFTPQDRSLVAQAAFFVLVPISVALHELGHAVAIKAMGGDILGFGYFAFAGYVAFDPSQFDAVQRVLIAFAGTAVNILLAALATGAVFFRKPPMRAAVNELLLQFSFISLLNALIIYPLLDVTSGMEGDWSQMYGGGVPWLAAVILAIQVGTLGLMLWMWKNPGMQARVAALTGRGTAPAARAVATGRAASGDRATPLSGPQQVVAEAAERVVSGWPARVEARLQARPDGTLLSLTWSSGGAARTLLAVVGDHDAQYRGVANWQGGAPPDSRPLGRSAGPPDADRLTLDLRTRMEAVEAWQPPVPAGVRRPA